MILTLLLHFDQCLLYLVTVHMFSAATPVTSDAGLQMLSMPAVSPQVQTGTSTLAPTYVKPVGNTPRGRLYSRTTS